MLNPALGHLKVTRENLSSALVLVWFRVGFVFGVGFAAGGALLGEALQFCPVAYVDALPCRAGSYVRDRRRQCEEPGSEAPEHCSLSGLFSAVLVSSCATRAASSVCRCAAAAGRGR